MKRGSLFLLIIPFSLLCLFLGLWQWERRAWKIDLINEIKEHCQGDGFLTLPILSQWSDLPISNWRWHRVRFSGHFVDQKIKLWRNGRWHIIQPFKLGDGFILIDRGKLTQEELTVPFLKKKQILEAVLYPSQKRRFFDVDDNPISAQWFVRDINKMAGFFNIATVFPLMADTSKNCPKLRNQHLIYVLIWWSLMLIFLLMGFVGTNNKKR